MPHMAIGGEIKPPATMVTGESPILFLHYLTWLVIWTHLKNISQLRWLSPIYGKIKFMFQTTNQLLYHSLPTSPTSPTSPTFAWAQGLLGRHHLDAQHDLLDLRADDPTAEDREEIRQDLAVRAVRAVRWGRQSWGSLGMQSLNKCSWFFLVFWCDLLYPIIHLSSINLD